jgi:hypothetical protein
LFPIGIAETFFLFTYNLELFKGKLHNNTVFVISWGILPVFAGSAIETNTVSLQAFALSGLAAALSLILIKTSKKYKRQMHELQDFSDTYREEIILKLLSIGVIASTISYLVLRYA